MMHKLLLFLVLFSCATHNASVAILPVPPVHPALEEPNLMSDTDRRNLAEFYRRYELYLQKLKAYKKAFG